MTTTGKKFQSPKGTRDFYPADMVVRRYIEKVWRETSINHGFEEVDGPTFEDVELYKHKSGPGIVSEIFGVFSGKDEEELSRIRSGADAPFALRPEFTPTLARMVAAKAAQLPKPIKWFAIPSHFRAERPQRGRLREFFQWNIDFIGGEDDPAKADAEVIACAVNALEWFGLTPDDVRISVSHREIVTEILGECGVPEPRRPEALALLDKRTRMSDEAFRNAASAIGLKIDRYDEIIANLPRIASSQDVAAGRTGAGMTDIQTGSGWWVRTESLRRLFFQLEVMGIDAWVDADYSIVRGLAYYTGTVFEIIAEGERAIAGGGRYDKLIESFGGPSLPACGFGMGDVVLANILHDKGLLPEELVMEPLRPHAFVIAADDEAAAQLSGIVASLRKQGFHIRHSYKTTRNVGKLLGEAGKARARFAVILGKELAMTPPSAVLKNLDTQFQYPEPVSLEAMPRLLRVNE